MKTTTIIGLCMVLVLMCGTAAADWNVTWTPVKESIIDKEYLITVQNLQDDKRDVNISSFFAETDFDISELSDVEFFEWAVVPYNYTVDHHDEVAHTDFDEINGTWNNWTEQVYNRTETIESTKLDWDECRAQLFKANATTKEDNYGFINIPKFGSEDDGDGTYNGTKVFKLAFRTPVIYDGSYGSFGKVALLLDGEEHHPYWNTSWDSRMDVILTGGTSGAQTDFQILLNVSWTTGMQADFDDLRFCNETHEIDSWVQSKSDSFYALVWVEFPTTPANAVNKTYRMYYGNAGVVNNWNGTATFPLFDDFDRGNSATVGNGWSQTGDAQILNNNCYAAGQDSTIYRNFDFGSGLFGITARAKKTTFSKLILIDLYDGSYRSIIAMSQSGSPPHDDSIARYGGLAIIDPYVEGQYYILQHNRVGANLYDMWADDVSITNQASFGASSDNKINILLAQESDSDGFVDWVHVRKYAANPSTYSFGSTQYYAGSIHYNSTSPYNHTIDSAGVITVNRSVITSDNINWTAAALTDDCHMIVTEYNLSNITVANFTLGAAPLDWLVVTNLTASSIYWLQFANGTFIEAETSTAIGEANFTTDIAPDDYQIYHHIPLNISLRSVYPETLHTNHTGTIQVNYIVKSSDPLNLSSLAMLYGINYTTTGDMHSYISTPPNSIASEGIYRAPNRNTTPYLSWENNATITEGNVWQWGGGDNDSTWLNVTPINSTHTWINATGNPEHIFSGSFYLGRRAMDSAPKTGFEINSQQGLIIKMWDNEVIRGRSVDYLMNLYFDTGWESTIPTSGIEVWGFNSSFNVTTDDPALSPFGAKIAEWDGNRWINHSWIPHTNSSYCIPLTVNVSSPPVVQTDTHYIYLKSDTLSSKSYTLNATNYDPGICNLTYAQTDTMWTYSELGDVSSPVAYTPTFFATFVRDDEQFLHHLYIADDQGEWAHSGINNISIGVSHYPVPAASIDYFNITCATLGYTHDTSMTATYDNGFMHVGMTCPADPDGGIVSHNLTIHYANESFVGIVNNTFTTTGAEQVEINFTTSTYYSTTDAYTLKCVSTDGEGSTATVWLGSTFTLAADGTQGYYMNDYLMFWGMNNIPTLYAAIANNSLISYDAGNDIYTMHVPFFKSKCNDTFMFNETVHLKSLNTEDVAYFRFSGKTVFDNANIHGWNTVSDTPAPSTDTYRGYVYACCRTTGNITNSNLSYLGSDVYQQEGVNFIDNTMDYLIYNTTFSHNSRGIIMEECGNMNISNCDVHDNTETGIGIYYSDGMAVENCTISSSVYDPGLYLYEASDNIIRHNTISDCVDYGMRIRSNSNNNTLLGNDISGSGIYDYYFSTAAINNTIRDPASSTDKIRATSTSAVNIENTDNSIFSEDSSNSTYAYPTNFSMSVTGVSHTFDITQRDMIITPNTGSIRVWNIDWTHIVKFNASNVSESPYVWFNITQLPWANSNVSIFRNGSAYDNITADASGHIAYNYSGGWSEHWFEFVPGNIAPDKPTIVTPANGATGTSTNPTLRVMVTDFNAADLLNVTFYAQGGAQIGSTQTGLTNGSTASVAWSGRSYSTTYYWYAVVDDGNASTQSDTWDFRTQSSGSGSSHVILIDGCTDWSGNAGNQVYIDFGCTGETAGATFITNATNGSIDSSTGIYTWNTASADAGVYNWRFNVENVYSVSDYCDVTITVYHHASPTNLAATTGNFWVNHTWDGNGFVDSYNVSVNDVWSNGSADQYSYHVRYPHAWSNISVAAFNDTTGLSSFISNDVQVPNNPIVLTNYSVLMLATAGDNITVDMNHEDLDGDAATYYCSRMDMFADFNTADGTGQYTNAVNGTHEVIFGVTDGYGWSNQTITIEVGTVHPLELDEETPLLLFVVLVVLLFGSLFYIYHAQSYVAKIVTALISTWMSFMLSNMAVSGNVVLNYAELSAGDVFIYGAHSIQIAALSHFFMFTGVVSTLFMLIFAIKLVIDVYTDMQAKKKIDEEWDGVE